MAQQLRLQFQPQGQGQQAQQPQQQQQPQQRVDSQVHAAPAAMPQTVISGQTTRVSEDTDICARALLAARIVRVDEVVCVWKVAELTDQCVLWRRQAMAEGVALIAQGRELLRQSGHHLTVRSADSLLHAPQSTSSQLRHPMQHDRTQDKVGLL